MLVYSILACIVFITYLSTIAFGGVSSPATPSTITRSEPVQLLGKAQLPIAFIPNQGQADPEVLFQAKDLNSTFFITATDLVFTHNGEKDQAVVHITHENARPAAVQGMDILKGQANYLLGSSPARWFTHLPTYATVMFSDLYPGIDMAYTGMSGAFESAYYVHPGADPAKISFRLTGSLEARLNAETGSIELYAASGGQPVLVLQAPTVYQQVSGKHVIVPSRFTHNANGSFSYVLSEYDSSADLVIDPTLTYSSYFGGAQLDSADSIALDTNGNIYVTGLTSSTDFPTSHPIQADNQGSDDIFVIKLKPDGTEMLYSTYLGGDDDEEASSIAVDSIGSVYLAGDTTSTNYPLLHAYDTTCNQIFGVCIPEAFITQLSPDGSEILYSSYLGGSQPDMAQGVTVANAGQAYLTGVTFSTDFPVKEAIQDSLKGTADAFVAQIDTNASGSASLVWSTYLGGTSVDTGAAITVNGERLVVTGETTSADFPVENALQETNQGEQDVFITGMTTTGKVEYSTYLGGEKQDTAYGIAANAEGAFITGTTLSTDFPTLTPAQTENQGGNEAFVTGISADGSSWLFSTYLGGKDADIGYGIAVDPTGGIYVTGSTSSSDFASVKTMQTYGGGEQDAFITKLDSTGSAVVFSTLLGGIDSELGVGIAVDSQGNSYIAGDTFSDDLPVVNALNAEYAGKGDVFVSILANEDATPVHPQVMAMENPLVGSYKTASSSSVALGETITYTIMLHNSSTATVSADVMDVLPRPLEFFAGTASNGGTYDATYHVIDWQPIDVPGNGEVALTYQLKYTTASTAQNAINIADIIADGSMKLQRFYSVKLGGGEPGDTRPAITSFRIGDQDVLTSRDVSLHLQATDDGTVAKMYLLEWQVNPEPFPHWELVKSSRWIPYEETIAWKLGEQSGVHYIAALVADDKNQISMPALDFASLLLPDTQLQGLGFIPYLVSYDAGVEVTATLTKSAGSPELFVWYPGNHSKPDHDQTTVPVTFTTPRAGPYYFLVYAGPSDAVYTLQITPGGGPLPLAGTGSASEPIVKTASLDNDPVLSVIGFDPLGSGTAALPTAVLDNIICIPLIVR